MLFDRAAKEVTAKIVYYGAPRSGKTTNLQFLQPELQSVDVRSDRLLFFQLVWPERIAGMLLRLELATAAGDVSFNSTKQRLLERADALVFVVDSAPSALDANLESLQNLGDNLKRHGVRSSEIPFVVQYNKRDLAGALPVAKLESAVNVGGAPHYEAIATAGRGVQETLRGIVELTWQRLARKHGFEAKFDPGRGR